MEIPRHWRVRKQRYALVGETCPHCQARLFPPREVCPHCGNGLRSPYGNEHQQVYSISVTSIKVKSAAD